MTRRNYDPYEPEERACPGDEQHGGPHDWNDNDGVPWICPGDRDHEEASR